MSLMPGGPEPFPEPLPRVLTLELVARVGTETRAGVVYTVTLKTVPEEQGPQAGTTQPVPRVENDQAVTFKVDSRHVLASAEMAARFALVRV